MHHFRKATHMFILNDIPCLETTSQKNLGRVREFESDPIQFNLISCNSCLTHPPLGVDKLDLTDVVEEEVLRLEVPVDDAARVEEVEGLHQARRVELGRTVVKVAAVPVATKKKLIKQSFKKGDL